MNTFFIMNRKRIIILVVIGKEDFKIYITNANNYAPETFKNIIIYFNSTNKISFQVKKYNFSIFSNDNILKFKPDDEYFQLCQGNNKLKELYFYTSLVDSGYSRELFTSVFEEF